MKRIFSVLGLCTICILCATSALSAPTKGKCGDEAYWSFDPSTGVLIISGKGEMAAFSFDGSKQAPWKKNKDYYPSIKTIIVEEGITSIGSYAFGGHAKTILLPQSLRRIRNYAFQDCYDITSFILPENVIEISFDAFSRCESLSTIHIGSKLSEIHKSAFNRTTHLSNITVSSDNKWYTSKDGVLYTKDMKQLICVPANKQVEVFAVPIGVEEIESNAFTHCTGIKKVVLPSTLKRIEKFCFSYSKIREIYYPAGFDMSPFLKEYNQDRLIPYDPNTYAEYYEQYEWEQRKAVQADEKKKQNINGQSLKVAILAPVDKEGNVEYAPKLMLRSYLAQAITESDGYAGYDRVDMDAITSEQKFQRTGLVSDDEIKRIGVLAGVQYVLISEAVKVDANNMYITAKLIDVETARTEKVDYQLMGTTPDAIQKGCATMAKNLLK